MTESSAVVTHVDEVLTTTRAVRKRLDLERPVPREVLLRCVEIALQAPVSQNQELWRFIIVDDEQQRRRVAEVYRKAAYERVLRPLEEGAAKLQHLVAAGDAVTGGDARLARTMSSVRHLYDTIDRVPVLVVVGWAGRAPRRSTGPEASGVFGTVLPAIWSFQLALRSRGLGSTYTCIHLHEEEAMREVLGIPETVFQVAMLPVAYTIGLDFRVADRASPQEVISFNRWGSSGEAG